MTKKIEMGDLVMKTSGYEFPGVVEGVFMMTQAKGTKAERYLVNRVRWSPNGPIPSGLGHIFAPGQLKVVERFDDGTY